MKAAPGFLLGSFIESELLLNPYSGIETQLEKKDSYMQSRVDKLHQYNEQAEAGITLTKSQDEARNKLDEVIKHQEYVKNMARQYMPMLKKQASSFYIVYTNTRSASVLDELVESLRTLQTEHQSQSHLITMIHRDHVAYDKALKAADSILGSKLNAIKSKAISQSSVYSEILKQLAEPSSLQSFISGTNGAIKVNENELNAVLRLRRAFDPSFEGFSSVEELEKRSAEAADIVTAILSETSTVVDKETGLQGKDAFALLESIKKSQFFMGGGFSCSSKSEESCASTTEDSAKTTESPIPTATEEGDRSYAEKPDSGVAIVNDSVDLSDHEELKCLGTTAATNEVPNEKPTSASAPVTVSESTDEHVESTNGSDSGNGTVTPSSDIQVAPPKVNKPTRGGKQFFKYRNSNYSRRMPNKDSSQYNNFEDRPPRSSNFSRGNGEDQQRRRFVRQSRRGARSNGFAPSNFNENDQRSRNNRPFGNRTNFQQAQAASFHYEPGVGRRPAPTTCGIIFGGRS